MVSPSCVARVNWLIEAGGALSRPQRVRSEGLMATNSRTWPLGLAARGLAVFAALGWLAAFCGNPAFSQSADCERLRQAIADASRSGQSAQFEAAAERQRAEIDRTVAYAKSIGCENRQFLFFGAAPPAQCGQINAQISRMRANLDDLQARAGGGSGGRGEMIARYNAACGAGQSKGGGLLDALFGQPKSNTDTVTTEPLSPELGQETQVGNLGEARAGSQAVCVRACDGSFFPVSYAANGSRLESLDDLCRAQCPNADVSLYTYPSGGEIEQAVSVTGARYMDLPTALKYRQSYDSSCSCRRKGQSWADALANAEVKLGQQGHGDIIVTPEKAIELSRPKADVKPEVKPDPKSKTAKGAKPAPTPTPDLTGVDANLSQQAATISRETSGIGGGDAQASAPVGANQGQSVEVVGPDGVKRRVRIVGPSL